MGTRKPEKSCLGADTSLQQIETGIRTVDYMKEVVCHFLVSSMDRSRRVRAPLATAVLVTVLAAGAAVSQPLPGGRVLATGSHTVRLGVEPIVVMAVSSNPVPLIVDRHVTPGNAVVRDGSSFYNLTSNVDNVRIEVSLDRPMPTGTHLAVSVASSLGRSSGWVDVTRGGRDVAAVTGMSRGLENGRVISFQFVVSDDVDQLEIENRLLTITVVDPVSRTSHTSYQNIQFGVLP